MNRNCNPPGPSEHCVPGCSGGEQWCEIAPSGYCPWGKGHLRDMVQQQLWLGSQNYNEVIVDGHVLETNAPYSIAAVFSQGRGASGDAHAVQQKLVQHFGISDSALPVLSLELWNKDAPFRVN